jgi:hypothetical protein
MDLGDPAWLAEQFRELHRRIDDFIRGGFLANSAVDSSSGSGSTFLLTESADGAGSAGFQFDYGANTLGVYQTSDGKVHIAKIAGATGVAFDANVPVTVASSFTVTGTKSFATAHPTVPGAWIIHAATESPVNGIEYWGTATLDAHGAATVVLPRYFEGLAKAENRQVQLTYQAPVPAAPPTVLAATAIAGGQFTLSGPAGATVCWLVKAERRATGDAPIEFLDETLSPPGNDPGAIPADRPGQPMSGDRPAPAVWPTNRSTP